MLIRTLAAAASVLALTACSTPAAALGSLADINVIDRVTGETLPMYWHDGRWWVPGKPGNRYAVSLTNRSGVRTLNVIAVDGVNVGVGRNRRARSDRLCAEQWAVGADHRLAQESGACRRV